MRRATSALWWLQLLALAALAACGHEPPAERWTPLTERLVRTPASEFATHPWRSGHELEVLSGDEGITLRLALQAGDWKAVRRSGLWQTSFDLRRAEGDSLEVRSPEGLIPRGDPADRRDPSVGRRFLFFQGTLALQGFGAEAPEGITVSCRLRKPAGSGRVLGVALASDGVELPSGTSAGCTLDLPADSALSFATSAELLFESEEPGAECVFEVRLDGRSIFESREACTPRAVPRRHVVPLPAQARAGARLEFAVSGALASTVFLSPLLGPRELGRSGARPWPESRPDLLIFLADTFRADNLAAYGSERGLTPNLDALARQSLCFRRAWSSATWTLPAHATLFSGFYPPQIGMARADRRLPSQVQTLAGRLHAAGYRTLAVTEGGFVSAEYGLDRGFEQFLEYPRDLERVLEQARDGLAADDGRPLFLFVHSYRVHLPYHVSDETRAALGERLGIRGEAGPLYDEFCRLAREALGDATHAHAERALASTPELRAVVDPLQALYLGGVADFDRDFGAFLEDLSARSFLQNGYLLFTSDHGEAFGEHERYFHRGDPYEERARIPLLIRGHGLAPGSTDAAASLIDLAPTLCALAGLPALPGWPGHSLLDPGAAPRALFGFEGAGRADDSFFVLEDTRKLLGALDESRPEGARPLAAFALDQDPGERNDLAHEAWPVEVLRKHLAALRTALEPRVSIEAVEVDSSKADELKELGY